MELKFYGVDFAHDKGEFAPRLRMDKHFISFFRTDFLYERDGELLRGSAGDMLILKSGSIVYHGPTPEMTEGFRNDWMYIGGDEFLDMLEEFPLPVGELFRVGGRHILAHAIEKIAAERAACADGYEEMCALYLKEAIIELRRAYIREGNTVGSEEKIKKLRKRLIEEPSHDWTLCSMAELCGYSESRFSALYKQLYGASPVNDLISIRLENAKIMLLSSKATVAEISEACGFSSLFYFSKCFKKREKVSPLEYKKLYSDSKCQ